MSGMIESAETDAFTQEIVAGAAAKLPDGPLEQLHELIDWESFREPLLWAWPWANEDAGPGRPSWMY